MAAETETRRGGGTSSGGDGNRGAGLLASGRGSWLGASPPGRPRVGGDGSSHMEAPSRKGQGASRGKRKGSQSKPERRQTQHGEAKRAEGQGEGRQARRGEQARAKKRRRAEEPAETEGAERGATAEKKGESRGRTPSKETGEGEERAIMQAGTSNDTNFCAASRLEEVESPRAPAPQGRQIRTSRRSRAIGRQGRGSHRDRWRLKWDGERGRPHRRQVRGPPRPGGPEEWRWR